MVHDLPTWFFKSTDTQQFSDPTSRYPYHCKKNILFNQMLRLNRISYDYRNFDKRCNELQSWLLEKAYNEKMVRKQILQSSEDSGESLLKKVK